VSAALSREKQFHPVFVQPPEVETNRLDRLGAT
jgi:hypothetical protein